MNPLTDPLPITHDLLILAAAPDDPVAGALATELQRLGWETIITDEVGAYAYDARGCVVLLLTPESPHGRAARSALSERPANMIPVVHPDVSPPYGRWSSGPIPYTGSAGATANAINETLETLLQGTGKRAAVSGYVPGGVSAAPTPAEPTPPATPAPPLAATPAPPAVSMPAPPPPAPIPHPTYPPPQPGSTLQPGILAQPAYSGMQPIAQDALEFALPTETPQDTSKLAMYAIVAGVALLACVLIGLLGLYFTRPRSAAIPQPHAASIQAAAARAMSVAPASYTLTVGAQPALRGFVVVS
jgi:hypothetical protein